jgi:hypothetical protein
VGAGVLGIGHALAALAPGYCWFAAALAISGTAALIFINGANSIMQLSTEPTMRGRVMALRAAATSENEKPMLQARRKTAISMRKTQSEELHTVE